MSDQHYNVGERNPHAQLTDEQVNRILTYPEERRTRGWQAALARELGASPKTINNIVHGRRRADRTE